MAGLFNTPGLSYFTPTPNENQRAQAAANLGVPVGEVSQATPRASEPPPIATTATVSNPSIEENDTEEILVFPPEIRRENPRNGGEYPVICFTYYNKKNVATKWIYLPMPPGIEFGDSMNYSTVDLGLIGDIVAKTIKGAQGETGIIDSLTGAASALGKDVIQKAKNANLAAAASIVARRAGAEKIANVIDFQNRQIIAPNTNTMFQGANTRSFNFKFKMMATSREQNDTIQDIVSILREKIYPMGTDIILEYPGTWKISFLVDTQQNTYLPRIYRCYLTSFTSAYNSANNMWHDGGAPVEVDVAMTFQEVKALKQQNIQKLNNPYGSENDDD